MHLKSVVHWWDFSNSKFQNTQLIQNSSKVCWESPSHISTKSVMQLSKGQPKSTMQNYIITRFCSSSSIAIQIEHQGTRNTTWRIIEIQQEFLINNIIANWTPVFILRESASVLSIVPVPHLLSRQAPTYLRPVDNSWKSPFSPHSAFPPLVLWLWPG